jgi:hypothetical protein
LAFALPALPAPPHDHRWFPLGRTTHASRAPSPSPWTSAFHFHSHPPPAVWNLQSAICNLQPAIGNLQVLSLPISLPRCCHSPAPDRLDRPVSSLLHSTYSTYSPTHPLTHSTHSSSHSIPNQAFRSCGTQLAYSLTPTSALPHTIGHRPTTTATVTAALCTTRPPQARCTCRRSARPTPLTLPLSPWTLFLTNVLLHKHPCLTVRRCPRSPR